VSTAVRASSDRLLFALGRDRETLRRIRASPEAAFCLMGRGVAFTAHGRARVVAEELDAAETVVAVELRVERVQDHLADGRTEMLDGARWRWTDQSWGSTEREIVDELVALAGS
jgi:hypothetical protein